MASTKNARLIGLFVFAILIFTFPILGLFGKERFILTWPALYVYIFVAWAMIIFFLFRILNKEDQNE